MMAMMGMLRPLAIIAAPAIGGLLGEALGWRAVFRYVLAGWGVLNAACVFALLPETRPPPDAAAAAGSGRGAAGGRRRSVCGRLFCAREAAGLLLTVCFLMSFPITFLSNIAFVLEARATNYPAPPPPASHLSVACMPVSHLPNRARRPHSHTPCTTGCAQKISMHTVRPAHRRATACPPKPPRCSSAPWRRCSSSPWP